MKNPKISVLMPIYNTNESHLKQAIDSILNQTYDDFELLILNDSPENTELDDIIQSYKDNRIKYIKNNSNLGISGSRNKLISLAVGEYIAVMDHDDMSLPERFAEQIDVLDNNKNIGVVGCLVDMIGGKKLHFPQDDLEIKSMLFVCCSIVHPASMIRKSILIDNDIYYEEKFTPAEDFRLWHKLIDYTEFHNIQKVLFLYRDHKENTSKKQKEKMNQATIKIQNESCLKHPTLYEISKNNMKITTKISLFSFIPILIVKPKKAYSVVYLFGFIPFLKIKRVRLI